MAPDKLLIARFKSCESVFHDHCHGHDKEKRGADWTNFGGHNHNEALEALRRAIDKGNDSVEMSTFCMDC